MYIGVPIYWIKNFWIRFGLNIDSREPFLSQIEEIIDVIPDGSHLKHAFNMLRFPLCSQHDIYKCDTENISGAFYKVGMNSPRSFLGPSFYRSGVEINHRSTFLKTGNFDLSSFDYFPMLKLVYSIPSYGSSIFIYEVPIAIAPFSGTKEDYSSLIYSLRFLRECEVDGSSEERLFVEHPTMPKNLDHNVTKIVKSVCAIFSNLEFFCLVPWCRKYGSFEGYFVVFRQEILLDISVRSEDERKITANGNFCLFFLFLLARTLLAVIIFFPPH